MGGSVPEQGERYTVDEVHQLVHDMRLRRAADLYHDQQEADTEAENDDNNNGGDIGEQGEESDSDDF